MDSSWAKKNFVKQNENEIRSKFNIAISQKIQITFWSDIFKPIVDTVKVSDFNKKDLTLEMDSFEEDEELKFIFKINSLAFFGILKRVKDSRKFKIEKFFKYEQRLGQRALLYPHQKIYISLKKTEEKLSNVIPLKKGDDQETQFLLKYLKENNLNEQLERVVDANFNGISFFLGKTRSVSLEVGENIAFDLIENRQVVNTFTGEIIYKEVIEKFSPSNLDIIKVGVKLSGQDSLKEYIEKYIDEKQEEFELKDIFQRHVLSNTSS